MKIKYITDPQNYPTNGFYLLNRGLKLQAMNQQFVYMYNITFQYGPISEPAMTVGDADRLDFEIDGQLVNPQADTGILDYFFEKYLEDTAARPMDFFEWVETEYDPIALKRTFKSRGWANRLVDSVLRRE